MGIRSHCFHRFVEAKLALELHEGALDVPEILARWYDTERHRNYGAYIPFVGTVREEEGISALSFDLYEPILVKWFDTWQSRAKGQNALLYMAHSIGDVPVHTSSYIAAIFSPQRRVALEMINDFVEDFKANAPIWKYDIIQGKRIYAQSRSHTIDNSGLLAKKD